MPGVVRRWTEAEDHIVRANPPKTAISLLKSRTRSAVTERRRFLGFASSKLRWTEAEDEVVRSNTIRAAAILLEGRRSKCAIEFRRKTIGPFKVPKPWSKIEDRRIRKTADWSTKRVLKAFPERTLGAIRLRRYRLGCHRLRGPCAVWKTTELKLLQQMWPTNTLSDILEAFPRHPRASVRDAARKLGLRKLRTFDTSDLIDNIRSRAHEDWNQHNRPSC
jgi:hypothetical protein